MLHKIKNSAVLFALLAVAAMLTLAACSEEMTNAEIKRAAMGMGMVESSAAMMSDQEVMAQAKGMGMMTKEEADAMAKEMMPDESMMMVGDRLAQVKERGKVICASRNDVPGYGSMDASGNNVGFDIDLCRALAAAVLGDPNAIEIRLISASERGRRRSSPAKSTCLSGQSPGRPRATRSGATTRRRCSSTVRVSW